MNALGFVEMPNLADAIETLDLMLKAADVRLVTWEKRFGGRLVTLIITGGLADVNEAVDSAKAFAGARIAASAVIGNPHAQTIAMVGRSARKNNMGLIDYGVSENSLAHKI